MAAVLQVFYEPGKLFQSLKDRPGVWFAPLLVSMMIVSFVTALTVHTIGIQTIVRQRLEGTRLTPEQIQTALERAARPAQVYTTDAAAGLSVAMLTLILAALLTVFGMMSSQPPRFPTMFSMVALAYLPYSVVLGIMTVLVLVAAPDPSTLNVGNLLATNAAIALDPNTTSKWLYSLAESIDVLSFAEIGLLSYGYAKVTRSSFGAGVFAVGILWILYVFARALVSSLF